MTIDDHRQVVVVGAGVMGAGIAQSLATAGCSVTCVDRSSAQLEAAAEVIEHGRFGLRRAVAAGRSTEADVVDVLQRLRFSTELDTVGEATLVLETIDEDLKRKLELFAQLGALAGPETVLASNTSGLPVIALGVAAGRPGGTVGWHWSSPATRMRMAEIARSSETTDAAVAVVVELAEAAGKRPIVVVENPQKWGFVANRVLFAAIREAEAVVREGIATPEDVDSILVDGFGWPAGPLSILRGASDGWGDARGGSVERLLGR